MLLCLGAPGSLPAESRSRELRPRDMIMQCFGDLSEELAGTEHRWVWPRLLLLCFGCAAWLHNGSEC